MVWIFPLIFLLQFSHEALGASNETEKATESRAFSIFSVVQFKNIGCRSTSTLTIGQSLWRNGTCYTASECSNKGGVASGNCASGFGVCCVFLVSTGGSVITQNCTYIRNPNFPSALTNAASISYTVNKCTSDVCYLRLDFESFNILGPSSSSESNSPAGGTTCQDTFRVTTQTGQFIPVICGLNPGQHIYVDIGLNPADFATLAFTFLNLAGTAGNQRTWEIKVSQIQCSNPNRPPAGCLQYLTTPTGRIQTFNFQSTTSSHLDNQLYNICIRQSSGFCCVQYLMCQGVPSSFSLDNANTMLGQIDTLCSTDYVTIPASSGICSTSGGKLGTKYCGAYLGFLAQAGGIAMVLGGVCDCSSPFVVGIRTDNTFDAAIAIATYFAKGVCLDYQQVPCQTN